MEQAVYRIIGVTMKRGDFLSVSDVTTERIYRLLDRALELKDRRQVRHDLDGKSIALVFQKPSNVKVRSRALPHSQS